MTGFISQHCGREEVFSESGSRLGHLYGRVVGVHKKKYLHQEAEQGTHIGVLGSPNMSHK